MQTTTETGVWDVDAEAYHADYSAFSNSMLKVLRESPRKFHARYITKTLPEQTPSPSMRLGSLKHIAALEPDLWDQFVKEIPAEVLAKNGAKNTNAYRDWATEHEGYILAKAGELETVRNMIAAVHANPIASRLLRCEGETEQSIRWECDDTSLPCKVRLDKFARKYRLILDLKTTTDVRPDAVSKTVSNFGYHVQNAHYLDGARRVFGDVDGMVFVFVSTEPPHDVATYQLDADSLEAGFAERNALLRELADRLANDDWRTYHEREVNPLRLPEWKLRTVYS